MTSSIELHKATVRFGTNNDRVVALDGLDLRIAAGEYVTIVGSNGAGKSTLVNVIAGSVGLQQGNVILDGVDISRQPDYRRARQISRVFQDMHAGTCGELTIAENMVLALLREKGRSATRRASTKARNATFAAELALLNCGLEDRLGRPAALLSGGQRQLVSLVMATMGDPAILLLDEHTSALDPTMAELVMQKTDDSIRQKGLTAIMVTHNMRHAVAYGDRILIMSRGRVLDDIEGKERRQLSEEGLIQRFRSVTAEALTDRILGS